MAAPTVLLCRSPVRQPALSSQGLCIGRHMISLSNAAVAEQVVWVLQRQQLLAAPQQAAVDTNQNTEHLSSPAFILPCAKSPTQHVTTEW